MNAASMRGAMVPVTRRIRAYFAPVDRTSEVPTIFDPAMGDFLLDRPPSPWLDLGWVENFERWYETSNQVVRSGARGTAGTQYRGPVDARVEFDFCQWGKLQMALAGGSEHMNVLAPASGGASPAPSGGTAEAAVALLAGSTASELVFGAGVAGTFPEGCLIAVDLDYQQQVGFVGSGLAAAYVSDPEAVRRDPDYLRRVTFNVGRVAEVTATSVVLGQPLLAGVPPVGASVQRVVAFVDRECGSFFQEWSALFVAEEESGGRVCFYYPRLCATGASAGKAKREEFAVIAKPLSSISLRSSFLALPFHDTNDGQSVLCYRSYLPAAQSAAY
jgi:hypothetical protein